MIDYLKQQAKFRGYDEKLTQDYIQAAIEYFKNKTSSKTQTVQNKAWY